MTYQIFLRIEAVETFKKWIAQDGTVELNPWLESRMRLVNQSMGEWVTVNVDEDTWHFIKDNYKDQKVIHDIPY